MSCKRSFSWNHYIFKSQGYFLTITLVNNFTRSIWRCGYPVLSSLFCKAPEIHLQPLDLGPGIDYTNLVIYEFFFPNLLFCIFLSLLYSCLSEKRSKWSGYKKLKKKKKINKYYQLYYNESIHQLVYLNDLKRLELLFQLQLFRYRTHNVPRGVNRDWN